MSLYNIPSYAAFFLIFQNGPSMFIFLSLVYSQMFTTKVIFLRFLCKIVASWSLPYILFVRMPLDSCLSIP